MKEFLLGFIIVSCLVFGAYTFGVNSVVPSVDYFWIDNNRFPVESTITSVENGEGFYTVIVNSEYDRQFIEFYDLDNVTAKDMRDSFLIAYREGVYNAKIK